MNEKLIENWNNVVTNNDIVYTLGDFVFYSDQNKNFLANLLNKLNYKEIHLILGNHDKSLKAHHKNLFTSCQDYKKITVTDLEAPGGRNHVVLFHYALRTWDMAFHGSWSLYGHSHGTLPDDPKLRSIDVGVDSWNYTPVSYEQIREVMKIRKTYGAYKTLVNDPGEDI